jgi:chromatin modification-related protein YNG2
LGLTKHLRTIVSTPSTTPNATPLPGPAGSTIPIAHLPAKDAAAITKIQNEWAKVEALQEEKVLLAERMERIVGRAKERGKEEWRKMGGEDMDAVGAVGGDGVWKAEMGIGEIMLPPGGLGGGGERSNKSESMRECVWR